MPSEMLKIRILGDQLGGAERFAFALRLPDHLQGQQIIGSHSAEALQAVAQLISIGGGRKLQATPAGHQQSHHQIIAGGITETCRHATGGIEPLAGNIAGDLLAQLAALLHREPVEGGFGLGKTHLTRFDIGVNPQFRVAEQGEGGVLEHPLQAGAAAGVGRAGRAAQVLLQIAGAALVLPSPMTMMRASGDGFVSSARAGNAAIQIAAKSAAARKCTPHPLAAAAALVAVYYLLTQVFGYELSVAMPMPT